MASSMEKKITELEMGLLHLQQNIDIPEITLTVHHRLESCTKVVKVMWKISTFNVHNIPKEGLT